MSEEKSDLEGKADAKTQKLEPDDRELSDEELEQISGGGIVLESRRFTPRTEE